MKLDDGNEHARSSSADVLGTTMASRLHRPFGCCGTIVVVVIGLLRTRAAIWGQPCCLKIH